MGINEGVMMGAGAAEGDDGCVCVECGESNSQALYREFTGGAIQLSRCASCKKVLDKYVEYDVMILLLDILLLRIQPYRHLIFNYDITTALLWKFSVILVLCEAYTKLRMLHLDLSDSVKMQVHFHTLFLQSIVEYTALLLACYLLVKLLVKRHPNRCSLSTGVLRVTVVSSFGKMTSLAAMVWTGDFYLWLPYLLVLPAQLQSLRALLGVSVAKGVVIVAMQNLAVSALGAWLAELRTSLVKHLIDL